MVEILPKKLFKLEMHLKIIFLQKLDQFHGKIKQLESMSNDIL